MTTPKQDARRMRREAALSLRASMSPARPAGDRLRVATWNINSLRARLAGVERFLTRAAPDVLCLQETKTATISAEAGEMFERHGYEVVHIGHGSYNGVAIASKHPISAVVSAGDFGDEHLDKEPRLIGCVVDAPTPLRIASVYVPHGREIGHWHYDYKLAFLDALAAQVERWLSDGPLVLGGDVNVAPTDSDIFHPDPFVGQTHVSDAERSALARVIEVGLVDLDARRWGADERRFSWWRYGFNYGRNLGMRIDLLASDVGTAERLDTTWIDHVERGVDKPSDHAALIADFHTGDDARIIAEVQV